MVLSQHHRTMGISPVLAVSPALLLEFDKACQQLTVHKMP